jgi:hypothetical protein
MYTEYKYIFPPRPETKISSSGLGTFEKMNKFLGQPKLNGSSMQVYTDGKSLIVMNRHKEILSHKMDIQELKNLHRGHGWMVLCGEYMNKNKKDETGKYWNIKFVIFDILVLNGEHLLGSTFEERYEILRKLYPDNLVKKHLHQISENCFRVDSINYNFLITYSDITKYQMYEGLVLKMKNGKLENGISAQNNVRTQIKCRKKTKSYAF